MSNPTLTLTLKDGDVVIEMLPDVAPNHVAQISQIAKDGGYDGIAWHRVIDGFMAQTGDVEHGRVGEDGAVSSRAGTGGSAHGNIKAEFSRLPFERGVCGMARSSMPDSANSQFFIMFGETPSLNGQYTVWGRVSSGMEHVDAIKRGEGGNGMVDAPDQIVKAVVAEGE